MTAIPVQRSRSGGVTVNDDVLEIQHLRVTHPETVALARHVLAEHGPAALADDVATAVVIGMIAGRLQRSTGDTTAVMERALAGFDEAVQARATATVAQLDGLLARVDATEAATRQAATDVLAALPTRIEQGLTAVLAGGAGNVREAVRQSVATAQAEALAQLERVVRSHTAEVRSVVSTENPSSPIAALRRDLTATVENTRRELVEGLAAVRALVQADQAQAAARSKSSAAGKDFEDAVADIVDEWAKATGDCVEHVGAHPGAGTTRQTGDVVVRVLSSGGNQPTIAIEAKRRARALTAHQHREELADPDQLDGVDGVSAERRGGPRTPPSQGQALSPLEGPAARPWRCVCHLWVRRPQCRATVGRNSVVCDAPTGHSRGLLRGAPERAARRAARA